MASVLRTQESRWMAALAAGVAAGLVAMAVAVQAAPANDDDGPSDERTGGSTTVYATGRNAFSFPLANASDEDRRRFVIGNSFFRRNWVESPSSTAAPAGLGPQFIARSCGGCPEQDCRGSPPADTAQKRVRKPAAAAKPASGAANRTAKVGTAPSAGSPDDDPTVALLMRLSVPGIGPKGGVVPEPT